MSQDIGVRVLLLGPAYGADSTAKVIDAHLRHGHQLCVNLFHCEVSERTYLVERFSGRMGVIFDIFAPSDSHALIRLITRDSIGFDAIVCPPYVDSLTSEALEVSCGPSLVRRLRVIGSPNDAINHLSHLLELAKNLGIAVINTPGVHAEFVAEYTLGQLYFHARHLSHFYSKTGRSGLWPHAEAMRTTHSITGKTIGVLGGSGKDGMAVVTLANRLGLRVIAIGSGSDAGAKKLDSMGIEIANNLEGLLQSSDFISVNCRKTEHTIGLIGAAEIALMKPGVIVINPSGAEIIDRVALLDEFKRPLNLRRIGTLVLDMPYGGRRDANAFIADPINAILKECGVLFTPRMAGYTVEASVRASIVLCDSLDAHLRFGIGDLRMAAATARFSAGFLGGLCEQIVKLAREAGDLAIRLREGRLELVYNSDGSPTTNADIASEKHIRDGLRESGYTFRFEGEELSEECEGADILEIVVDGIDGTRNFRDGNYGWCVSIAARKAGQTIIGVVHDPLTGHTYVAQFGQGAELLGVGVRRRCVCPSNLTKDFSFSVGSFRVAGSTAKKSMVISDIKALGGREREWGCVALSICAVARGGLGIFIQGNSKVHDHVAALLVASEAGASVEVIGSPQQSSVDVIVTHPSLRVQASSIFRTHSGIDSDVSTHAPTS